MPERLTNTLFVLRIILFASTICFGLGSHHALSAPVPVWAVFSSENSELPDDQVQALAVGPDGALWAGTVDGGIARFDKDGHWQTFNRANTNGGLPNDQVLVLALGPDGGLWAGTFGGGLARLDKNGRWQTFNNANTNGGLPNDRVLALALGLDGSLWTGTVGGGLARLDKVGHWQTFNNANTNGGLPSDAVSALARGPDGSLWAGTLGGGLARLDKDGHWQTFNNANTNGGLSSNEVSALALGKDGSLWVGTLGGGLSRIDKDGHWQTYSKASTNGGLPHDQVQTLAFGQDGSLWAGTAGGGLARLEKDGHWQRFNRANTDGGLPSDAVSALAGGSDGSLWIGTFGGGLGRFDNDGYWQTYNKANTNGGLPNNQVVALSLGRDKSLWAGTLGGGLARLDKDGHWQTFTKANTNSGIPIGLVRAVALGADGLLWAGTVGGGLARLDKEGHWQNYTKASTNGGLPHDGILALALEPNGSLWVGTLGGGLARLDKDGHWQTFNKANTSGGLPDDQVKALALGLKGSIWIGTNNGLARLDTDGHWQTFNKANTNGGLPDDQVQALALGPEGSLWIGAFGSGLTRLDSEGYWKTYTRANTIGGLPDDQVRALAPSQDGSLWVGTDAGLARFNTDGHWVTFNSANTNGGLPDDAIMTLAIERDGSVWVGTVDGGLGHLNRAIGGNVHIINVIGKDGEVAQAEQTVVVTAFDGNYLTRPGMFRYIWRMDEIGLRGQSQSPETRTKSPVYRVTFSHNGTYRLRVIAVDRYGDLSNPRDMNFKVTLPKPTSMWDNLVSAWKIVLAVTTGLYFLAFAVLLLLTRRSAWAFRIVTDAVWASWLTWPFFFLRHAPLVQRWVLEPWFQNVRRSTPVDVRFMDAPVTMTAGSSCGAATLLGRLSDSPRIWLHGRSGMGKSSIFAAWERAYFVSKEATNLDAVVRRYGFILIMVPLRRYAPLPVPDPNRPESWLLEAVRRHLEQFGVATSDIGLVDAMLKAGHIALALDGINEVDRDDALAAFASQRPQVRLLVTSQTIPKDLAKGEPWEVWELPNDVSQLREGLLSLWLGPETGKMLSDRIGAAGLSSAIVSGYDLRLLADLVGADPEHAHLPTQRVELYRAMLARATDPDGQPLRLENLKQLAWTLVTGRRRRIASDDQKTLSDGTLQSLEGEGLRIVRKIGAQYEFRHDQMRAFLAALWLVEETPTLRFLQKSAVDAGAFGLNRRDQEELWNFVAPLLTSQADLDALWQFANEDPVERGILLAALQTEADKRGVTLVRKAQRRDVVDVMEIAQG